MTANNIEGLLNYGAVRRNDAAVGAEGHAFHVVETRARYAAKRDLDQAKKAVELAVTMADKQLDLFR